jgi:hypothetical protein
MKKNSAVNQLEAVKQQLVDSYIRLKAVNDEIRQSRANGAQIDELAESLTVQRAMFEQIDYLKRIELPPIILSYMQERKRGIPQEIQQQLDELDNVAKGIDEQLRAGIAQTFEQLFLLGARLSGNSLTLPGGFFRFAVDAQTRAGNGEIAKMRRRLLDLELQARNPVNVSLEVERIDNRAQGAAREQVGFHPLHDYVNPCLRGLSLE